MESWVWCSLENSNNQSPKEGGEEAQSNGKGKPGTLFLLEEYWDEHWTRLEQRLWWEVGMNIDIASDIYMNKKTETSLKSTHLARTSKFLSRLKCERNGAWQGGWEKETENGNGARWTRTMKASARKEKQWFGKFYCVHRRMGASSFHESFSGYIMRELPWMGTKKRWEEEQVS